MPRVWVDKNVPTKVMIVFPLVEYMVEVGPGLGVGAGHKVGVGLAQG